MKKRTNKYIRAMRRFILISIFSLLCLIGSIIWFALTPKSQYIWDGWLYILLIVIFSIASIIGLFGILANYGSTYYRKERYKKIIRKYEKLYDPQRSILVEAKDLMYYLNIKYLGGDRVSIKINNHFYVLERQVFPNKTKGVFSSIYSFDHNIFGARFDKLLDYQFDKENSLNDLKKVEVVYHNNKYPKQLNIRRNYDNCLPHRHLTLWATCLTLFGCMSLISSTAVDDWYVGLIIGAPTTIIGVTLYALLIKKHKDESLK